MPDTVITGTVTNTVTLASSGYGTPLTITSTGAVNPTAYGADGVDLTTTNSTLVNAGIVQARYGADATTNAQGGAGGIGVNVTVNGTVSNQAYAIIAGGGGGRGYGPGYGGAGLVLAAGGVASNAGTISGGGGAYVGADLGFVAGAGGDGVSLAAGGTFTNTGTVQGGSGGTGGASSYGTGYTGGAGGVGVYINGGTLIDSGFIGGGGGGSGGNGVTGNGNGGAQGDAVQFGATAAALLLETGASLSGHVVASAGVADLLELAGTGILNGIGTNVQNFGQIRFASGAAWTLSGDSAGFNGVTLSGLTTADALDITDDAGPGIATLHVNAAGILALPDNAASGGKLDITLAGIGTTRNVYITPDGTGGADVTLFDLRVTSTIASKITNGVTLGTGNYNDQLQITSAGTVAPSAAGQIAVYSGTSDGSINNAGAITGGAGSAGAQSGGNAAIGLLLAAGALTNDGVITGGAGGAPTGKTGTTAGGAGGAGASIKSGTLVNDLIITGGTGGAGGTGATLTVGGIGGNGVSMTGGSLVNAGSIIGGTSGAAMYGRYGGDGILLFGGTVTNDGMIEGGAGDNAVGLYTISGSGGITENRGGYGGYGVELTSGTLTNAGTIIGGSAGTGKIITAGGAGAYVNGSAALTNEKLIIGGSGGGGIQLAAPGVKLSGGKLTNIGTIIGGAGNLANGGKGGFGVSPNHNAGVYAFNGATLMNAGLITGSADIYINGFNTPPGLGAYFDGGILTNAGTIEGGNGLLGGIGVSIAGGGLLTNTGIISGGSGDADGVRSDAGTLVNEGTMDGGSAGTLAAYGGYGVYVFGGTLTNAGTITGGTDGTHTERSGETNDSVRFNAASSGTLIVDPGAVFNGNVVASTAQDDVLVLAGSGAGTLSGFGSQFTGFSTLSFAAASSWTVDSTAAALGGKQVINGFATGDTIMLEGLAAASGTFVAGTGLELHAGTVSDTLDLSGSFTGEQFFIATQGTTTSIALGTVSGATIASGTAAALPAGSIASATLAGGTLDVSGTSTLGSLAITGNGAEISLGAGAALTVTAPLTIAIGTTLDVTGGTLVIDGAISLSGDLTETGTSLYDDGVLVNNATITLDPSYLSVASLSGTGVTTLGAESTLDVAGDVSSGQTIVFDGADAELQITDTAEIEGTLSGAGTIEITDLPSFSSASYHSAAHLLGITFNGTGSPLELHGYFAGDTLSEQSDGSGGTELIETPLCYLHGTRILTPSGQKEVEDLAIGDAVVTRFGGIQRIKWLGRQSYAPQFIANNKEKWPVCIKAGALADGVPARDLWVSQGHAMLLGDVLVLASNLVNGVTVTQTWPATGANYVQLDLGAHDCVVAEGAWSETYADAPGQRAQFHNAAEYEALYPDEPPVEALTLCAARPEPGPKLAAARMPVAERAARKATPGPLEGWIDIVGDWKIEGWASDLAHAELPVALDILLGDRMIGTALACDFRQDLRDAGKGGGRCAFSFTPPFRLRADALPTLAIRRAADGVELPGTERFHRPSEPSRRDSLLRGAAGD